MSELESYFGASQWQPHLAKDIAEEIDLNPELANTVFMFWIRKIKEAKNLGKLTSALTRGCDLFDCTKNSYTKSEKVMMNATFRVALNEKICELSELFIRLQEYYKKIKAEYYALRSKGSQQREKVERLFNKFKEEIENIIERLSTKPQDLQCLSGVRRYLDPNGIKALEILSALPQFIDYIKIDK